VTSLSSKFARAWGEEPHLLLCDIEAKKGRAVAAVDGNCPVHVRDECLSVYGQLSGILRRLQRMQENEKS
jgi:hypothetical protein